MHDGIFHYTTLETLKLILQNKTIRFNRMDRLDDELEEEYLSSANLAPYFFTSCWTTEKKESIPQWNMYSKDMRGVRIKFSGEIFNHYYDTPIVEEKNYMSSYSYMIPREKMFSEKYFVLLPFKQKKALKNIVYLENSEEIKEIYKKSIILFSNDKPINLLEFNSYQDILKLNGTNINLTIDMNNFGIYKIKEWEFQKEARFIIAIFPSFSNDYRELSTNSNKFVNDIMCSIVTKKKSPLTYFDVDINQDALNNIEILMGPKSSEEDYNEVKKLISNLTKNGKIKNSELKIRDPKRK